MCNVSGESDELHRYRHWVIQEGRLALLKKQALWHTEQTIRDIEEALQSDEELTPSEQAELTYLSWHFIASLSRWKRRQGRAMQERNIRLLASSLPISSGSTCKRRWVTRLGSTPG